MATKKKSAAKHGKPVKTEMQKLEEQRMDLDKRIAEIQLEPITEILEFLQSEDVQAVTARAEELRAALPNNPAGADLVHIGKVIAAVADTAGREKARMDALVAPVDAADPALVPPAGIG